jgi:hypothetical protein
MMLNYFMRDVQNAFAKLRARVEELERQVSVLTPLLDLDRLEVAKT